LDAGSLLKQLCDTLRVSHFNFFGQDKFTNQGTSFLV